MYVGSLGNDVSKSCNDGFLGSVQFSVDTGSPVWGPKN
jgi:hypothetical protein